eukprot:747056-Prymnesium_polylepis.1
MKALEAPPERTGISMTTALPSCAAAKPSDTVAPPPQAKKPLCCSSRARVAKCEIVRAFASRSGNK